MILRVARSAEQPELRQLATVALEMTDAGSADRSLSKKRGSDQNARPITRGGEVRAGIPEVPYWDRS